jgi:hypothetical protein
MQTYIGLSGYASTHPDFNLDAFFRQYPPNIKRPALALLYGTFGRDIERPIAEFIKRFGDRPHLIEIHMANGAGRRAGRLGAGEFGKTKDAYELSAALEARNERLVNVYRRRVKHAFKAVTAHANERTTVIWSPELESNLSDGALHRLAAIIQIVTGSSRIAAPAEPYLREVHGCEKRTGKIYNLDGCTVDFGYSFYQSISPERAIEWGRWALTKKPLAIFLWDAAQQGVGDVCRQGAYYNTWPRDRLFVFKKAAIDGNRRILLKLNGG